MAVKLSAKYRATAFKYATGICFLRTSVSIWYTSADFDGWHWVLIQGTSAIVGQHVDHQYTNKHAGTK
jgi:hypothetical protein